MAYRICKMIEIESGHMLSKHPANCKFPHGHSRKIEILLEADTLDKNDMVCDFAILKELMKNFLNNFDHALCINTSDPMYDTLKKAYGERIIGFEKQDPTTEVVAKLIFDKIKENLDAYCKHPKISFPIATSVRLKRVRVWETSTSWAEYEE
ncbi:MAG: 6-carboxytetrahydropterin synthase [Candidatus Brocadiae bacterium]|nr:6-carboxytetrahydropterin synthase [Candidatus Brocadiia bacterium]